MNKLYFVTHYEVKELFCTTTGELKLWHQKSDIVGPMSLVGAQKYISQKFIKYCIYEHEYKSLSFLGLISTSPRYTTVGDDCPYCEYWQIESNDDEDYPNLLSKDNNIAIYNRYPKERS